jgi:hypothetical protein
LHDGALWISAQAFRDFFASGHAIDEMDAEFAATITTKQRPRRFDYGCLLLSTSFFLI